ASIGFSGLTEIAGSPVGGATTAGRLGASGAVVSGAASGCGGGVRRCGAPSRVGGPTCWAGAEGAAGARRATTAAQAAPDCRRWSVENHPLTLPSPRGGKGMMRGSVALSSAREAGIGKHLLDRRRGRGDVPEGEKDTAAHEQHEDHHEGNKNQLAHVRRRPCLLCWRARRSPP